MFVAVVVLRWWFLVIPRHPGSIHSVPVGDILMVPGEFLPCTNLKKLTRNCHCIGFKPVISRHCVVNRELSTFSPVYKPSKVREDMLHSCSALVSQKMYFLRAVHIIAAAPFICSRQGAAIFVVVHHVPAIQQAWLAEFLLAWGGLSNKLVWPCCSPNVGRAASLWNSVVVASY